MSEGLEVSRREFEEIARSLRLAIAGKRALVRTTAAVGGVVLAASVGFAVARRCRQDESQIRAVKKPAA